LNYEKGQLLQVSTGTSAQGQPFIDLFLEG